MGNVLGIIAEYNPFHNGHFYHLQESMKKTNSDYCICVISGNFTQRGEPSIINKWSKAYMALCGGANLVIELPTIYSVSSAENFAYGAINILNSLNLVNFVSFGAECNDMSTLNNIANVLYQEPIEYKNILSHELKKGISYPSARENALMMYLNDIKRYSNILNNPNNILAVEYLKALKSYKSKINPILIPRKKVYYNDVKIVDDFASATGIRQLVLEQQYNEIRKVVPASTYKILTDEIKRENIVLDLKKYEREIIYILRKMTIQEIANLPDVSEGLEYSIKKAVNEWNSISNIISVIKSKRYTQSRIQRILVYALLGINKQQMDISKKIVPYIRILGLDNKGKELISNISKLNPKLKVITSVNKFVQENINKKSSRQILDMLRTDIFATDVYTLGYKYESKANLDYTKNMVIL